jgi:catechol 2,3-dioxygenase-like lactoylglutathione lyase family enzyme
MEQLISKLICGYEQGALSRRYLIGSLVALLTAPMPARAAGLNGRTIDHVSLQVRDVARSRDFYARAFNLSEPPGVRADGSVRLDLPGSGSLVLRTGNPVGVDHLSIRIDRFDEAEVTRQLAELGITAVDGEGGAGFHVVDPDGFNVQIQ